MDLPTIDTSSELAQLRATVRDLVATRRRMGESAAVRVESISLGSPEEHLYHIALATDLALRNVQSLAAGRGRLIIQEGQPNELALQVFRDGTYPRGESEAPRMVQPPTAIVAEYLTMELDALSAGLDKVEGLLAQVARAPGFIPHQDLGALTAAQWLCFARLHAGHHLSIVSDIANA